MKKRGRPRKERYARLMGGFWRNDKVRRLSLEARGLLVTAWSYAADQATDGKVPVELLRAWSGSKYARLMKELGAFLSVPEGEIDAIAHNWTEYNITAAEWERRLESDRKRKRRQGDFPTGNPTGNPLGIPSGTPDHFRGSALDEDEDEDEDEFSPDPVVVDRRGRARARARDNDHHHDDGWVDELVVGGGCPAPAEEARSGPQGAPRTPAPATPVPQHPREDSRLSEPLRPATPLAVVHAAEEAAESARIAHEDRLVHAASGAYARALHAAGGIYDASPRWRDALRSVGRLAEQVAQRDGRELECVLREWAERYVRERETRRPDWWLERVTAWTSGVATAGPSRRNGRLPPGTGAGFPTGDIPPAPMPKRVYGYGRAYGG